MYNSLERLEELGLAKHVIQNGRKKFSANTPTRLLSLLEEKKLAAQSVVRQLQERFSGTHEQDFEVYQGESAFIAHQLETLRKLPEGSAIDVIASDTERYMHTFETYGMDDEYEEIRISHQIHIRYIGAEAQQARLDSMERNRQLWTYKILPGHSVGLMSIEIHPADVNFVTYGDPILDYAITNPQVAEGYRQFFEVLWKMARK